MVVVITAGACVFGAEITGAGIEALGTDAIAGTDDDCSTTVDVVAAAAGD